ncbi:MAG TPA: M23 family metallopeptidase [Polyangia bacterium]|nr:M23 family metallopeptidase [Polyangia bacterium]
MGLWANVAVADPTVAPADVAQTATEPAPPRSRDTLAVREMILVNQVGFARGTARWRARELYRLMQNPTPDDGRPLQGDQRARAVLAGLNALRRDRQEQAALTHELGQVRAERAERSAVAVAVTHLAPAAAEAADGAAPAGGPAPPPAFVPPVDGPVESPFGPARDAASGIWLFHPGVRLRARPGEAVRAPDAGVVRRLAEGDAGRTIVVQHEAGWITIVSGLGDVTVSVGQAVTRGQTVGHVAQDSSSPRGHEAVLLEVWHRRQAVDPAAVLRR